MPVTLQTATIPPGECLSNAIDCSAANPMRIRMPPAWTGGNQGIITFQVSTDNITYMDYFQADGREISAIVTPGTTVRVDRELVTGGKGATWIKIRTGGRESPVIQRQKCDFVVVFEAQGP